MFLLLIVGNMRNMQYNMQQYAKYANTISICRICTPHFADVPDTFQTYDMVCHIPGIYHDRT